VDDRGEGGHEKDGAWHLVYRGPEVCAAVSGLSPGASLRLRVCATNVMGPGPFSDVRVFSARTLPPTPPDAPTFSQLQAESVKVRPRPSRL